MVYFFQNPLSLRDFLLYQSPWKKPIVSSQADRQGSSWDRTNAVGPVPSTFPLSGLPVGSCWNSSLSRGSEQAAVWYRAKEEPGLESQDLRLSPGSSLNLLAESELCLVLTDDEHQQKGMGIRGQGGKPFTYQNRRKKANSGGEAKKHTSPQCWEQDKKNIRSGQASDQDGASFKYPSGKTVTQEASLMSLQPTFPINITSFLYQTVRWPGDWC